MAGHRKAFNFPEVPVRMAFQYSRPALGEQHALTLFFWRSSPPKETYAARAAAGVEALCFPLTNNHQQGRPCSSVAAGGRSSGRSTGLWRW